MLLEAVILRGDRASQPAANTVPIGSIYFVTDEGLLERSDGATWETYSGANAITELTGDVTAGPGSGSEVATIPNDTVTYAKMQDVSATSRVLGRVSGGAGNVEELTLTQLLDFVGGAAQGDILYRDAAAWDNLAPGTAGQVLTSGGAAANPSWASPTAVNPKVISRVVINTEIHSLNTVPIVLVAAPGATKIIVPVRAIYWVTRTTTAFSADPSFRIRYNGITTTELIPAFSFFLATASAGETFRTGTPADYNFGYGGSDPRNRAVELSASADTTTGTGTLRVSLEYYIAELP